ncbi:MAG TPA: hypothetical protein VHS59_06935, partial [Bacillota bacterium]|nr:hypothetical protein [Bacillota bacterium]
MPVLHQLAALSIDQSFPWRESWLKNLGDLVLDEEQHHPNLPTLELRYLPRAQLDCMRELTKDIMVGPHSVYDGRNRLLLELNRQSLVLHSARPCLEWMEWGLQLIMLRAGATFIHSAAVEKAGRAVVFASWGRVGKTPLLIGLIRDQGWNLLGDDLVILTQDGRCLGFPKPMVLYPYHQPLLPEVFAAGRGPVTPSGLNFLLAHLGLMLKPVLRNIPYIHQLARKYNPQSVRIKPSEVFGDWKIATEAKL